jgi:signal transduction histidine kinase
MPWTCLGVLVGILLLLAGLAPAATRQPDQVPVAPPDGWNMLVLLSDEALTPASSEFLDGFREVWQESRQRATIDTRHLDVARFAGTENDRELAKWLTDRYRARRIDAVVSAGRPASDFLRAHGPTIWPNARTVFAAVSEDWGRALPPHDGVVITTKSENRLTSEEALRLLPDIRQVFLIAGSTASDRRWLEAARRDLATRDPRLAVHDLADLEFDELMKRVAVLPADSVAMATVFFADAAGRTFVGRDAYSDLAAAANRPMFTTASVGVGAGLVGGLVVDYRLVGQRAARAAARELTQPRQPASLHMEPVESRWMFDARQLARWGIHESRLPVGSVVLFREPSWFQRNKNATLIGLAVLVLQAVAIVALLIERRSRRRIEAQNQAVLASMSADLAVIDRKGVVVNSNDGWARAAAVGENPFVSSGRGQQWLHADAPRGDDVDAARLHDALNAVIDEGEDERIVEYAWQADGGHRKWSHVRVSGLPQGERGAVVTHVDISVRKQAEIEVLRTLHELSDLNMRAGVGEIVASVAHEVNQPLTAALLNAQALKRLIAAGRAEPDEVVRIVDDIIEGDQRATDVIKRIHKMLRKEQFDLRSLDLNVVVNDVVQLMSSSATNEGVQLTADLESSLPSVRGDRVQLQQVAMNLVINGIHATRGHVSPAPAVRVATRVDNDLVYLVVDDTGPGVDESALSQIFEPFFSTKKDGLGVGLSISRSIVEMHGGRIDVTNLDLGGARFTVTLPAA